MMRNYNRKNFSQFLFFLFPKKLQKCQIILNPRIHVVKIIFKARQQFAIRTRVKESTRVSKICFRNKRNFLQKGWILSGLIMLETHMKKFFLNLQFYLICYTANVYKSYRKFTILETFFLLLNGLQDSILNRIFPSQFSFFSYYKTFNLNRLSNAW